MTELHFNLLAASDHVPQSTNSVEVTLRIDGIQWTTIGGRHLSPGLDSHDGRGRHTGHRDRVFCTAVKAPSPGRLLKNEWGMTLMAHLIAVKVVIHWRAAMRPTHVTVKVRSPSRLLKPSEGLGGDDAQGTPGSGDRINSLAMRKVSRGIANEVSQIYLVPSPECWESTESLIGDLYATENARPLWRCAPTDVITDLFADQANQPAVLFTANAALLFLLVEQSELIDNVMYDCREAITELYRRWISMGQVPKLARASVLEHDGIRAVVMATGRVDHIPGAFVQFFHMEKEEVSLCWKIVRSEMCCTRIGNVR